MIDAQVHHHTLRVYYEDTDAGGIVYHARFLAFAERGRTEALRALQVPHQELVDQHGLIFVVRRVKVDYRSPARLDDLLCVQTRVVAVSGASVTLDQAVMRPVGFGTKAAEVARLEVLLACVRLAEGRAVRVPARWADALAQLIGAA